MDEEVNRIINELDHSRLDTDIDHFRRVQSTGENIASYINDLLTAGTDLGVEKIKIWENSNSYFEHIKEENQ